MDVLVLVVECLLNFVFKHMLFSFFIVYFLLNCAVNIFLDKLDKRQYFLFLFLVSNYRQVLMYRHILGGIYR